ncbi:Hypothetical predicted protein [Mytilus galloprovincialis]|uniref:B box-type domain-containing protein n=2 Tax=Mytilus galloprovincialis TaxID=29158 RepID=A0A8B6F7T9_MYTGA|nr:Hypothetical predicted protein [Mytilus galloprovincialis]
MAFPHSNDEAQIPALCQFCEESNIKWKCINCDLFLCQLCNSRIHNKSKASKDHTIINLKDCGTAETKSTILTVDLQNMPCTIHSEIKCWVYCNNCAHPICADCSIESHQKHEYKQLDAVFNAIISAIDDLKKRIDHDIQWYEHEKLNLEQLLSDGDKNFQNTKDKIIETEKEMKDTISRYASDLLQELETKWRPQEIKIKRELSHVVKNKDDLVNRKVIIDKTLQSHQSSDIFSVSKSLVKTLPEKSKTIINLKKTIFFQGFNLKNSKSEMSAVFGNIKIVSDLE